MRRGLPALLALPALLFAACQADTEEAQQVTATSAVLVANVDWDNGDDVAYWFEYRRVGASTWTRDDIRDPAPLSGKPRNVKIGERVTGLEESETYEYRLCGYITAPYRAGSLSNPVCFDTDRNSDPPFDYDRVTTLGSLPPGFRETTVFSGLTQPTAVRFSPDGRVFVAEKSGLIKQFDSLSDTTPAVFADLRNRVHDYWDRGLLGIALHPAFPANSSIYALYTHDAPIGGTAPVFNDGCNDPSGNGCVVSARLSRLGPGGSENVLIEDWCAQYPSHTIGSLAFGPDGALYVGAGEGASFDRLDWGQDGNPRNPCGDPPGGVGAALSPPSAEGGALRSQDLRSPADPTTLDGAILRVNAATGAGAAGNPLAASSDLNARRIVAHGLRNPFRMAFRPGTNELWIGEVGWTNWEEINRLVSPADATVDNFGWPCYEGDARQPGYDSANLSLCETLYGQSNAVVAPHFKYSHGGPIIANEPCTIRGSSVTGLAFAPTSGGPYPSKYDGALFFADYSRNCIWAMRRGSGGLPSPAAVEVFGGAANPIDLQVGPGGNLYYVDLGGTVRRIEYDPAANRSPTAVATADPTEGEPPLTVSFDGTASSDPDGDNLNYEWDLDGDGAHDDSTDPSPTFTYDDRGEYAASLRVSDGAGGSDTDSVTIGVGRPDVTISAPVPSLTWAVDDTISFSGSATDNEGEPIPASDLSWSLVLHHGQCPACHQHPVQTFDGVADGSFLAPDHEYPSSLELSLTATDSSGLEGARSVVLMPRTTTLSLHSAPMGLTLGFNATTAPAPFANTVIVGSRNTLSAPSPQTLGGTTYTWVSWSNGGAGTQTITAPATAQTYTATYQP